MTIPASLDQLESRSFVESVDVANLPARAVCNPDGTSIGSSGGSSAITSVIPGTSSNELGKAEDAPFTSGDTGVLQLAVRQDTLASSTSTDGDYAAIKVNFSGANYTQETLAPGYEDQVNAKAVVELRYSYLNITSATTTTVKSGSGVLHGIIINKGIAAATITIYDNTAGSGTKIGTITFGAALLSDPPLPTAYNISFTTGLTIVTSGATDLTVIYR